MIKDFLNHRNQNKKVLARCNGWSIVELPDHVDANGVVYFRFAIARTDEEGNTCFEDGVIMSLNDLMMLPDLIDSAKIRESVPFKDYEAEHRQPKKQKPLFC